MSGYSDETFSTKRMKTITDHLQEEVKNIINTGSGILYMYNILPATMLSYTVSPPGVALCDNHPTRLSAFSGGRGQSSIL